MGLGRFFKRITTPHKALRPILGRSILDEIGTVGGFLVGGPGGAAAGRGLGKFAATGDVKQGLGGAVEGYMMGQTAAGLGLGGGAMKAGASGAARAGADKMAATAVKGVASGTPQATGGFLGALGRFGGGALDFAKSNPDLVLGGLGALNSIRQNARADGMRNEALGLVRQDYESRAPLRQAALGRLLAPEPAPVDLSHLADAGNPYATQAVNDRRPAALGRMRSY